jgi:hypothetical protein
VKPPAVFQSDEETDTDFESDSDYLESDHAVENWFGPNEPEAQINIVVIQVQTRGGVIYKCELLK